MDDGAESLALWRGLVDGRWTLLGWVDRDGRRFLVARRRTQDSSWLDVLSDGERAVVTGVAAGKSNKLIGYELGIAEGAVAQRLRRALGKLGVSSRVELIRRVHGAEGFAR